MQLALVLLLSQVATASASTEYCLKEHLNEAIALNRLRRPLYAQMSDNKSVAISNWLIFSEKIARLFSGGLDRRTLPYQKAGIPIICNDLRSMNDAPAFSSIIKPLSYDFRKTNVREYRRKLKKLKDFDQIVKVSEEFINEVKPEREMHCMVLHVAEAIERAARNAPGYIEQSKASGLKSTEKLSRKYISSLTGLLSGSEELDRWAAPVHKAGIPIICQDVP